MDRHTLYTFVVAFVACTVTMFGQMPPISSPLEYRVQPFDAVHYDVTMRFPSIPQRKVSGICTMSVAWNQAVAEPAVPFHLRGLTVDSVTSGAGTALQFLQQGTPGLDTFHYRVRLPLAVAPTDTTSIIIYYHGTMKDEGGTFPWGGVHYEDSVLYTLGVGFRTKEVSSASYWMPCYDHPSDKATLAMHIALPYREGEVPWQGAISAASIGTDSSWHRSDSLVVFNWQENHPTATYLYTFAVGPFRILQLPPVANVPVTIFSRIRDTAASAVAYKLVPKMTEFFNQLFGPFPFDKVGYVNTVKGAMEHQTLISFPITLVNNKDTINTTAAHELAHQWFGDLVTPLDFRHTWLTESFATYGEGAWIEHMKGWDAYLADHTNGVRRYLDVIWKTEGVLPLYNYSRVNPSTNYPETIYRKGAIVLAMARTLCGTEPFYSALRTYLTNHRYGNATTQDMVDAFRPALGTMADAFFNQWVYGKGWPQLQVTMSNNDSSWTITIEQIQHIQRPEWPLFTTLPLNLTYTDPVSGQPIDTVIVMTGAKYTVEVASPQDFSINTGKKCRSLLEIVLTTSVTSDAGSATTFSIRPQPATDTVTLEWQSSDVTGISITGLDGKVMRFEPTTPDQRTLTVNVNTWPQGMYHVALNMRSGTLQVHPIVVVR